MEEDKENIISLSLSIGTSHQPEKHSNDNKNKVQQQLHVLFPASTTPEDYEIIGGDIAPRKKLRLTKEQSDMLENSFRENNILNGNQKQELARKLDLQVRQVEVWFQNRRARTKLKKTEVECEFLRRYCQSLSEENKRLKKELQALKLARPSPSSMFLQISKQAKISAEGDGKSSASSDSLSDKSRIYNCS